MVKGMLKVKVKVCSNVVKRGATGYRIRGYMVSELCPLSFSNFSKSHLRCGKAESETDD